MRRDPTLSNFLQNLAKDCFKYMVGARFVKCMSLISLLQKMFSVIVKQCFRLVVAVWYRKSLFSSEWTYPLTTYIWETSMMSTFSTNTYFVAQLNSIQIWNIFDNLNTATATAASRKILLNSSIPDPVLRVKI